MSKKTERPLSDGSKRALDLLKENPQGLTIAEMKELGFENVNSSHLTSLKGRGLATSETETIEVQIKQKRRVQRYKII